MGLYRIFYYGTSSTFFMANIRLKISIFPWLNWISSSVFKHILKYTSIFFIRLSMPDQVPSTLPGCVLRTKMSFWCAIRIAYKYSKSVRNTYSAHNWLFSAEYVFRTKIIFLVRNTYSALKSQLCAEYVYRTMNFSAEYAPMIKHWPKPTLNKCVQYYVRNTHPHKKLWYAIRTPHQKIWCAIHTP